MVSSQKSMQLDWEGAGLPEAPTAPDSLKESGLSLSFLNDLTLRTLYLRGSMLGLDLARFMCLPFKVIEEAINKLLGEAASVVTAIPDEQRGEKLIAFYSRNGMTADELWAKLNQSELPKLWIPKRENIYCIDSIPVLGSGKIDLKKVKLLALRRVTRSG